MLRTAGEHHDQLLFFLSFLLPDQGMRLGNDGCNELQQAPNNSPAGLQGQETRTGPVSGPAPAPGFHGDVTLSSSPPSRTCRKRRESPRIGQSPAHRVSIGFRVAFSVSSTRRPAIAENLGLLRLSRTALALFHSAAPTPGKTPRC